MEQIRIKQTTRLSNTFLDSLRSHATHAYDTVVFLHLNTENNAWSIIHYDLNDAALHDSLPLVISALPDDTELGLDLEVSSAIASLFRGGSAMPKVSLSDLVDSRSLTWTRL